MSITVFELIEQLQGCNPDAEVRFASQPSWPFENEIDREVVESEPRKILHRREFDEMSEDQQQQAMNAADEDILILLDEGEDEPDQTPVVYLGEGRQIGYLPGNIKSQLGW